MTKFMMGGMKAGPSISRPCLLFAPSAKHERMGQTNLSKFSNSSPRCAARSAVARHHMYTHSGASNQDAIEGLTSHSPGHHVPEKSVHCQYKSGCL